MLLQFQYKFAGYNEVEKKLNIDIYFVDPYSSDNK